MKKKVNKNELEYTAPEIIRGENGDSKVDIWSLGVLTYTIIEGMSPFYDETEDKIKENILKSEVSFNSDSWLTVEEDIKDFIRLCLNKNPALRPTADELNEHLFIKNYTTKGIFDITKEAA